MSEQDALATWDGMRVSDALLAIDGGGTWVLASEHRRKTAALESALAEAQRERDEARREVAALSNPSHEDYATLLQHARASLREVEAENATLREHAEVGRLLEEVIDKIGHIAVGHMECFYAHYANDDRIVHRADTLPAALRKMLEGVE